MTEQTTPLTLDTRTTLALRRLGMSPEDAKAMRPNEIIALAKKLGKRAFEKLCRFLEVPVPKAETKIGRLVGIDADIVDLLNRHSDLDHKGKARLVNSVLREHLPRALLSRTCPALAATKPTVTPGELDLAALLAEADAKAPEDVRLQHATRMLLRRALQDGGVAKLREQLCAVLNLKGFVKPLLFGASFEDRERDVVVEIEGTIHSDELLIKCGGRWRAIREDRDPKAIGYRVQVYRNVTHKAARVEIALPEETTILPAAAVHNTLVELVSKVAIGAEARSSRRPARGPGRAARGPRT